MVLISNACTFQTGMDTTLLNYKCLGVCWLLYPPLPQWCYSVGCNGQSFSSGIPVWGQFQLSFPVSSSVWDSVSRKRSNMGTPRIIVHTKLEVIKFLLYYCRYSGHINWRQTNWRTDIYVYSRHFSRDRSWKYAFWHKSVLSLWMTFCINAGNANVLVKQLYIT